ncbi:MAG: ExbD/TolR family protein [Nitrospiria bacterium]
MKRFSKSSHSAVAELNITPLLDLAWVLLVIFILATVAVVQGIEIDLPQSAPNQTEVEPTSRTISIQKTGLIYLDEQKMTLAELEGFLTDLKKAKGDKLPLIIKGDAGVEYRHVIGVLDVLQRIPIENFALVTKPEDESKR